MNSFVQRCLHVFHTFNLGFYIFQVLTNSLWYITNQQQVIRDASIHDRDVTPVPSCWDYQGYNEVKRKKLKEQPMSSDVLETQSQTLLSLSERSYMTSSPAWRVVKEDIQQLATCFHNYAEHLKMKVAVVSANQSSIRPVRVVSENISVKHHNGTPGVVFPRYRLLDIKIRDSEALQPVLLDENVHLTKPFTGAWQRFDFIQKLQLSVTVDVLQYQAGGSTSGVTFL